MFKISIAFFLIFISLTLNAQKKITHTNLLWFNYNNTIFINKKWSIVNDAQLRTRDWASRWSQFAVRSGAVYKLNEKSALTAGFTWFGNVRYFNDAPVVANEWRPWQEASFQIPVRKVSFIQRMRLEQRFLQMVVNGKKLSEYEFRLRLRYRFEFGYPFHKGKFNIHAGNEVMVNINYLSDNRCFDQDRIFLLLNTKISPSTIFQFQYIKIFQWQAANNILDDQNVFRFSIHQQFHLKQPHK